MMNRKSNSLSAFSLLEKALRKKQSSAMHSQSPSRFLLTGLRPSAFSLAEAMVMLVVISIIMAVSAPLIAHKATADQNRLIIPDGQKILTAQGGSQILELGRTGVNNDKLVVHGNETINGNSTINAKANGTTFSVKPLSSLSGSSTYNLNGFKVFADGHTNIRACVPFVSATVANSPAPSDGYIVSNQAVTINSQTFLPQIITTVACSGGSCTPSYSVSGSVMIPVAKDTVYTITDVATATGLTVSSGTPINYFYSCAKPTE